MILPLTRADLVPVVLYSKDTLVELAPFFDINLFECDDTEQTLWFTNYMLLAAHNVGIAHCILKHQVARGFTQYAKIVDHDNNLDSDYAERLGCYSVESSGDTLTLKGNVLSGTKKWITSADQADFAIVDIADDTKIISVYLDLAKIAVNLTDDGFNPMGMLDAKPYSLELQETTIPDNWIVHTGKKNQRSIFNKIQIFKRFGFIANNIGCASGLLHAINVLCVVRNIDNLHDLSKHTLALSSILNIWNHNMDVLDKIVLDRDFWNRHDILYGQSKQLLSDLLKCVLDIGNSRCFNQTEPICQRFLDAVVWNSHFRSPYDQITQQKLTLVR